MSSQVFSPAPVVEPPRRHLTSRQAETVDRLVSAAVDEVRASGYDRLTVRGVARRAGVAAATAYTYFTSKDHLLTEVFWRRIVALPTAAPDSRGDPAGRVRGELTRLALVVAGEPELAAACTTALLAADPEVRVLRTRIGAEMRRRVAEALGEGATPEALDTLDFVLTGALVRAGMGHVAYDELPTRLGAVADLILGGTP